jgi:1,4-dihydroxy-2-naphthoate octaprenyltransferase
MNRTLRGVWLEVRVIPVLPWSFSALTVGTALAAHSRDLQVWLAELRMVGPPLEQAPA